MLAAMQGNGLGRIPRYRTPSGLGRDDEIIVLDSIFKVRKGRQVDCSSAGICNGTNRYLCDGCRSFGDKRLL